jgi:allantoicase
MAHAGIPSSSATSPHVVSFRSLSDLACANVGGRVLSVTDEFFAPASDLLKPEAPLFVLGKFTEQGKWMDGWESRRKRVSGYDHCIIALGTPGTIAGFTVDTSYFVGNFPESCSIEGAALQSDAEVAQAAWTELIPKSQLSGGTANYFGIGSSNTTRYTHIRFNIFPDGGVARLRVHGQVLPDWSGLVAEAKQSRTDAEKAAGAPLGLVDVASVLNGAKVITSNDAFFGSHSNLILPGRAKTMGDGWETRRKRILPGFDWIIVELGHAAKIKHVEVDTNWFKGNFPDSALIEGCCIPKEKAQYLQPMDWHRPNDFQFVEILPQVKLQASHQHYFGEQSLTRTDAVVTHIRMKIFPDGGISRLRMWGEVQL